MHHSVLVLGACTQVLRTTDARPRTPVHHTALDTYDHVRRVVDPTLGGHVTLARVVSELALQLSSLARLPLDARELGASLEGEFNALQQDNMGDFKSSLCTHSSSHTTRFTRLHCASVCTHLGTLLASLYCIVPPCALI